MMKRLSLHRILLGAALLGLLSGCVLPGLGPTPTPYPSDYLPTVIALTGQSIMATTLAGTPSPVPTETPAPTETPVPPTLAPTETFTPSPSAPGAQVEILAPGPMSKIISPLQLRMNILVGGSELVQIELLGEDGRLLARSLERVPSRNVYISLKIPFEVRAAAEFGRLTVSTKDEYGQLQSVASVHVLLLSVGSDDITPVNDPSERLVLYTPEAKGEVGGGEVAVEGRFQPFNDLPVIMELITQDGKTAGLRVLTFNGDASQAFSTTIPYKVSEPTPARLVVRQDDTRISGLFYLYSQEIVLLPE